MCYSLKEGTEYRLSMAKYGEVSQLIISKILIILFYLYFEQSPSSILKSEIVFLWYNLKI